MRTLLASVLILAATTGPAPLPPFEAAMAAMANFEFTRAAKSDPDPRQRDLAALRLANIEWRVEHDAVAAGRDLDLVRENGEESPNALLERARIAGELRRDFPTALDLASRALSSASRPLDRIRAAYVYAFAGVEPVRLARLDGRCGARSGPPQAAIAAMKAIVAETGYTPAFARMLVDSALLSNDGKAALAAWRGYYGPASESALLAAPSATLAAQLSTWAGNDTPAAQRRAVGLALADSRFFTEAVLVLRDPCAHHPLPADDPRINEVIAYEAAIRKLTIATDEYYRQTALHRPTRPSCAISSNRPSTRSGRSSLGKESHRLSPRRRRRKSSIAVSARS